MKNKLNANQKERKYIYTKNQSVYTTRFNCKSLIEHVHIIHTYAYTYINLYI